MPEEPAFHYCLAASNRFAMESGVTQGSMVTDLRVAYPNVVFIRLLQLVTEFTVEPPAGPRQLPSLGILDGDVGLPQTRVAHIDTGWDRNPAGKLRWAKATGAAHAGPDGDLIGGPSISTSWPDATPNIGVARITGTVSVERAMLLS